MKRITETQHLRSSFAEPLLPLNLISVSKRVKKSPSPTFNNSRMTSKPKTVIRDSSVIIRGDKNKITHLSFKKRASPSKKVNTSLASLKQKRPSTILETLGGKIGRRMNQEMSKKESSFILNNVKRAIHTRKSSPTYANKSFDAGWVPSKFVDKSNRKSKFVPTKRSGSNLYNEPSPKSKRKNADKLKLQEKSIRREYEEKMNTMKKRYEDMISTLKSTLSQALKNKKESIQSNKEKTREIVVKNTQKLVHKAQISSLRKKVSIISKKNNRLAMQLEDVTMKLQNVTENLRLAQKELHSLKYYETKHHNIDVSEMHKTVRNLENELEMYRKKNAPQKGVKFTNKICTVCKSQIDKYSNRVKKIVVQGGRNRDHAYPANVFLSSDEEEDRKEKRKVLIDQQEGIMKEVLGELKGYTVDVESFGQTVSIKDSEDDDGEPFLIMKISPPNDKESERFLKKYLALSNSKNDEKLERLSDSDFDSEGEKLIKPGDLLREAQSPSPTSVNRFLEPSLGIKRRLKRPKNIFAKRPSQKFDLRDDIESAILEKGNASALLQNNF
ncbi:unnamed protein product [Moneuplotes crassus]|uniref:Uncharacterized protein n=1 Tax=Euplotes crassus TaxID=5936 RepID=A0AAD1UFA1_EUPCR|nr:unnamed protein product [Moneuplotes crassus]